MPARILIIEDNPANLDLMTYLLKAFGHDPLTAFDAEKGFEIARREKPNLIVCDIQLPGMDGYALAHEVRAEAALRTIPLVAVTALAMVGDRKKVLAGGFDGYISKPIDPETFVAQVDAFLPPDQRATRLGAAAAAPDAVHHAKANHITILAVDDQPVNLSLKRSILEPLGYRVLTADGMARAMESARHTPPDLIVSDLGMSDGSGFDFIKAVKADDRLKDIPFIFVTSTHRNESARAKGLALGAAQFLFRPIEPKELLAEIEACLSKSKRGD
jgi:two-component system, cell cycle response regulator